MQVEIKMKQLEEIEIDNEIVYFRKGFLGWHIVHPIKINNKINWKNLIAGGNYWKLLIIFLLVLLILGCIWEYVNTLNVANECLNQSQILKIIPPLT